MPTLNLRASSRPSRLPLPFLLSLLLFAVAPAAEPIDRPALVARHNPVIRKVDPDAPLTVGNGGFAFGAADFRRVLPAQRRADRDALALVLGER
jgi:hypothetical protein